MCIGMFRLCKGRDLQVKEYKSKKMAFGGEEGLVCDIIGDRRQLEIQVLLLLYLLILIILTRTSSYY